MASERILTDPLKIPAINLIAIRKTLENMERRAVLTFLFKDPMDLQTKIAELIFNLLPM